MILLSLLPHEIMVFIQGYVLKDASALQYLAIQSLLEDVSRILRDSSLVINLSLSRVGLVPCTIKEANT